MRSLWLAVLRLYLLMGADLGRGFGPRFFGCLFRVSVSIRFWIEHARSVIDLSPSWWPEELLALLLEVLVV